MHRFVGLVANERLLVEYPWLEDVVAEIAVGYLLRAIEGEKDVNLYWIVPHHGPGEIREDTAYFQGPLL